MLLPRTPRHLHPIYTLFVSENYQNMSTTFKEHFNEKERKEMTHQTPRPLQFFLRCLGVAVVVWFSDIFAHLTYLQE